MATSGLGPLLVIVGETASGKSALALRLAQQFNGEIICADSTTVRRGADIGTAKPPRAERQQVPHHLLDIVEPDEAFTAAQFQRLAQEAIKGIGSRGKLAIMVGGTGLYIDSVLYDYEFLAAADPVEREALNLLSRPELVKKAEGLGLSLDNVDVANPRRLIRLIETGGRQPSSKQLRHNTLIVGLETNRDVLKQRVAERVDVQLAAGLEAEVRSLAERYDWACPALQAIAYAQWREYFQGNDNLAETRSKIIKANLDLAKRQRTWFKRNKSIQWLSTPVNWQKVVDLTTTFLES